MKQFTTQQENKKIYSSTHHKRNKSICLIKITNNKSNNKFYQTKTNKSINKFYQTKTNNSKNKFYQN